MALDSRAFYKKYGHPKLQKNIVMWDVPTELEIGVIPKRIYCNADIIPALTQAFKNLIERKKSDGTRCVDELKTWDGCYNFRPIRGYEKQYQKLVNSGDFERAAQYLSVHSWGNAVDVNAYENGLGKKPLLSAEFVKCFTDAGFEWGGNWKRLDGMHFQLAKI